MFRLIRFGYIFNRLADIWFGPDSWPGKIERVKENSIKAPQFEK
jgi:hypothetical protein